MILPSLTEVKPEGVVAGGQVAVWEGQCRVTPRVVPPPQIGSPSFPCPLTAADFALDAGGRRGSARIRVIQIRGDILNAELALELPVSDGKLQVDPQRDLLTAEEAMLQAARAILEAGGGYGVVKDGRVELLPLPMGGIISTLSAPEVAARLDAIESSLRALGCQLRNPFLTLQTLTFTAIPSLRLTSRGLLDVKANRPVDLFL